MFSGQPITTKDETLSKKRLRQNLLNVLPNKPLKTSLTIIV
jgi:hypothetical protein